MNPTYIAVGAGTLLVGIAAFGNYYLNLLKPQAAVEPYGTSSAVVAPSPTTNPNEVSMPQSDTNPIVTLKTNRGDIAIELFTDVAPTTAGNFLTLSKENYYDGVKFHRVIDGFMIQGGDPLTKDDSMQTRWGTGGPGYTIPDEFAQGLSNVRGTLSMANAGPNTGGSQFFINQADNTFLDGKHAVFGTVVSGMEVVDAIAKSDKNQRDVPLEAVVIGDVEVKE